MDVKRILIVEDRRITAAHLKANIEQCGYKCVCIVSTGEEAIQKANELKPDLILMDIMLGGEMDGIQAAAMIREQLPIPIIFLTAFTRL